MLEPTQPAPDMAELIDGPDTPNTKLLRITVAADMLRPLIEWICAASSMRVMCERALVVRMAIDPAHTMRDIASRVRVTKQQVSLMAREFSNAFGVRLSVQRGNSARCNMRAAALRSHARRRNNRTRAK